VSAALDAHAQRPLLALADIAAGGPCVAGEESPTDRQKLAEAAPTRGNGKAPVV
jgi:hypothetical protein